MTNPAVLVTGANGHLGRLLLTQIASEPPGSRYRVRAAVRSERAAAMIPALPDGRPIDTVQVDYTSEKSLAEAAAGCFAVVHLVGIIKETATARYADAHERTCEALVRAAAGAHVERIVYLSILGSHADAKNTCLASKGRAEQVLLSGHVPACVLRVPMVLGPDDYASFSLRKQAQSKTLPLLGGGATLQQPIDARDVVRAILAALGASSPIAAALDLGGPECTSHRELVARAARLYDMQPKVIPLPLALFRAGIRVLERISKDPPMTVAMLDVLQHDDRVDTREALERLGLSLTPLDQTLAAYVGPDAREKPRS